MRGSDVECKRINEIESSGLYFLKHVRDANEITIISLEVIFTECHAIYYRFACWLQAIID